jgi:hypothetical protein
MTSKRKQIIGVGFLCLVVFCFAALVQVAEARRTPAWQRALAGVWPIEQVIETAYAQRPEAFALVSDYVIRDGGSFAYGGYVDNGDSINLTIALPAPRAVYCVVVRHNTTAQLVFVNYYTDNLYRSGWVVIDDGEIPVTVDTQQQLNALGCRLPLSG